MKTIFLWLEASFWGFFSFQNNLKELDPSFKMDLNLRDLFVFFFFKKNILELNYLQLICTHLGYLWRENVL